MVYHRLSLVADHLMYVALPAATATAAVLVVRGIRNRNARIGTVAALCALLFVLTFQRSAVLHDSTALWADSVRRNPDAPVAHNNLGDALAGPEPARAMEHFRRAIELNPDYAKAHYNLAFSLAEAGQLDDAIDTFYRSISIDPTDVSAQRDLGRALLLRGQAAVGLEHLRVAASLDANHTHVKYWLGIALSRAGQYREAVVILREQVSRLPADAILRYELSRSLIGAGEAVAAGEHLREAHVLATREGNVALVKAIEALR